MREEFLQYVWRNSLYNNHDLHTTQGEPLSIIHPGELNKDSGPDFFNSKLILNHTLWAGNIEAHTRSSEWMQHGHQYDKAYNNVILHVVYEHDEEIVNELGHPIPTLELGPLIPSFILARYSSLYTGKRWIACEQLLEKTNRNMTSGFKKELLIERLEDKARYIMQDVQLNKHHWEQTFYEYMARNFGFKINALPFHIMAKELPLDILARHKNNLLQIEALLFGQAGMLNNDDPEVYLETYPNELKKEYSFLKKKYGIRAINYELWKFSRMRPANFPGVRMAQLAKLIFSSSALFSKCMEIKSIKDVKKLFDIKLDPYWENHYTLGHPSPPLEKKLGMNSIENIVINTIVPFMYAYGKQRALPSLAKQSVELLQQIKKEKNHIISKWESLGFDIRTAFDSQAFIQLKNMYCTPKKCLSCNIGHQVLKTNGHSSLSA